MRRVLIGILCLVVILSTSGSYVPNVQANSDTNLNDPSLTYSVSASPNEFLLEDNGKAQGKLDISINPQGSLNDQKRNPVDVVFVFDKSGSMDDITDNSMLSEVPKTKRVCFWFVCWYEYSGKDVQRYLNENSSINEEFQRFVKDYQIENENILKQFEQFATITKLDNAKQAVIEAVNTLGKIQGDNLTLLPFDANIRDHFTLDEGDMTQLFGLEPYGNTNYTQSLEKARELLTNSNNSKHIIFLTDGEPTVTIDNNGDYLELNKGEISKSSLVDFAKNEASRIANEGISLDVIGFGTDEDLDMSILNSIVKKTDPNKSAIRGTAANLNEVFRDIVTTIDQAAITATKVKIKLPTGVTLQEGANASMEGDYATISAGSFQYLFQQNAPSAESFTLPLVFEGQGMYVFDDIQLIYNDINLREVNPLPHEPVTVYVKPKVAPTFSGQAQYQDNEKVQSLVKYGNTNGDSNRFYVNYNLQPVEGYLAEGDTGTISQIKLTQIIPDGLSVLHENDDNIRVYTDEEGKKVEILFNDITYSNEQFSLNSLTKQLFFQADWAMTRKELVPAKLEYVDSNFGQKTVIINAPETGYITSKVVLQDVAIIYEGIESGFISKLKVDRIISKIQLTNATELMTYPVKSMQFIDSNRQRIKVTYSNDKEATLYLVPDIAMFDSTGTRLNNNAETTKEFRFKLSKLVPGDNVTYKYRLKTNNAQSDWVSMQANDEIWVTDQGISKIEVQASGGFAKENQIIKKQITYKKPVTSISITTLELEVGNIYEFEAEVLPSDAYDKSITWSSSDSDILYQIGDSSSSTFEAVREGRVRLTVSALDGSNVTKTINLEVIDPYVPLERIAFRNDSYNLRVGADLFINDEIIFTPSNATNKVIVAQVDDYVRLENVDGQWTAYGEEPGYAVLIVSATEAGVTLEAKTVIKVINGNSGGSGNNGGNTGDDYNW
ncbi:VWA domain-containing protein [Bacillus sp. HMF5848]|uniref:VWA domain-containing protein n=1 Tax=Bacillus sp. HMF5848 TaxID=2495421 RepID=UPI000F77479F|nr:VWA domain-containing protein [Bacillus sp. HMF5848]RSK28032.1 VWA domain-containing protein [Bacillus sp. HMF5848]